MFTVVRIGSFNKAVYDSVGEEVNHHYNTNYSFSEALATYSKYDVMTCHYIIPAICFVCRVVNGLINLKHAANTCERGCKLCCN